MILRSLEDADIHSIVTNDLAEWVKSDVSLTEDDRWVGNAITVEDRGVVVAICGLALDDDTKEAEAWFIGCANISQYAVYIHRSMLRFLNVLLKQGKVKRIWVTVDNTSALATRWVNRLGFIEKSYRGKWSRYALEGV